MELIHTNSTCFNSSFVVILGLNFETRSVCADHCRARECRIGGCSGPEIGRRMVDLADHRGVEPLGGIPAIDGHHSRGGGGGARGPPHSR